MATYSRTLVNPFSVGFGELYAMATVTIYKINESTGAQDGLATLYSATSGTSTLTNPQTLDGEGKFSQPIYIEDPYQVVISGLSAADHTTGVYFPNLSATSADAAEASSVQAQAAAARAENAADRAEAVGADAFLQSSNNLDDVADGPTALSNIGGEPADADILKADTSDEITAGFGVNTATLTGASPAIDLSASQAWTWTITATPTLNNPTGEPGDTGTWTIIATTDSSGPYTMTLGGEYTLKSGSLTLAASTTHLFVITQISGTAYWLDIKT